MPTNVCKKCGYSSAEADYCPNDGTKMDKIGFGEKLWENLSDQQKQELLNAYYPGGNFSQTEESKHGKIKLPASRSQSGTNVKKAALERAYAQAKAFNSEKGREEFAYRISYSIIAILLLLIGSLFGLVELALMGTTQNGADGFSVIILSIAIILFACGICLILLRLSDMLTAIVLSIPIAHAPAAPVRTDSASARTSSVQPSAKTAPVAPSVKAPKPETKPEHKDAPPANAPKPETKPERNDASPSRKTGNDQGKAHKQKKRPHDDPAQSSNERPKPKQKDESKKPDADEKHADHPAPPVSADPPAQPDAANAAPGKNDAAKSRSDASDKGGEESVSHKSGAPRRAPSNKPVAKKKEMRTVVEQSQLPL